MSRSAEVSLFWGDGERTFKLGLGQLRELEDRRGIGVKALLRRLLAADDFVDDAREVIRLGLRGAGVSVEETTSLLKHNFDPTPLTVEHASAALQIIQAAIEAPERDAPGKPTPAETAAPSSTSAGFTEISAPSGTAPTP